MFSQACVILFTAGGGGLSASVHAGIHPPGADLEQTPPSPPEADTPPGADTPGTRHTP